MKDQFTQNKDHKKEFEEQLKSIAEHTDASQSFRSELEQRLMSAHQVRSNSSASFFKRALPMLSWTLGLALLALFLNWAIQGMIRTPPAPAANITITPAIEMTVTPELIDGTSTPTGDDGYDWRGTKLYLAQPLPDSPTEANVYLKKFTEQVSRQDILALAQRFEVNGEIEEVPGDIPGTSNYTISDGKERLEVRSDHYFTYHSNFGGQLYLDNLSEERAKIISDDFLKKHNFNFEYKFERAPDMQGMQFYIMPLTSDGYEMHFDYMQPIRYEIILDNTGENIIFSGYPIDYESVGIFDIITVEDALQKILDPYPQFGLMETTRGQGGGGGSSSFYKLNLSGTPVPFPSPTAKLESDQANVEYLIKEGDTIFAIAESYGVTPDEIFQANDWLSEEHALKPGKTLIIPVAQLNSGSNKYIVQENDTLTSIALNHGITVDELMRANGITDPIIFVGQELIISDAQVTYSQGISLPEDQITQLKIGQHIENERGIFQVNIYEESQRIEYGFFATALEKSDFPYLILEGDDLQSLQKYNNRPINIWGTVERFDQYGKPIVKIERYEIPFPDLDFQIIEGRQKMIEIEGKDVLTFTTDDGTTYVQIGPSVDPLDADMLFGNEDDKLLMEVLIIPDEIYKGYPTLRMYSGNLAVDPISGEANELSVTANQFNTYNEQPATTEVNIPPTATIEKVDFVYYVRHPVYALVDPNAGPQYLQPIWRFYGHYSNGHEFEILVQALKEEFLLPELAPYTPPG